MKQLKNKIPLFCTGDIGGLTYTLTNNIVNYLIVIATLSGVLAWPDELVYGRVIPGMSIGLMLSGIYYAYMAYKLGKKEGRSDVTALPSGVSTPAMFVILYGVIMPLHYALEDPYLTWSAATAACFIGGFVEFMGGFIGPWMKKRIPRAALLGTVAGIGFIWMATQGVFDVFSDPIIGLPILLVAMVGVFGGYLFRKKFPPLVFAILGGILYALLLGRTQIDFSGVGLYFPDPVNSVQSLINGFSVIVPYLTIIIPIEIYNFIETMDNVEAANVAGDAYNIREAQFADGIWTMVSATLGGVVPNTVWLGHAGLKKSGAKIGFSWAGGVLLGIAGIFGLFTFFSQLVPPAIAAITYLWCSVVMVSQAFKHCNFKHYAAIAVAMVPPIADFLFTQITNSVGLADVWTEVLPSGVEGYTSEVAQYLIDHGVMWRGVAEVKSGAIIIGIILGSMVAFIIDKKLDKVAITSCFAAILTLFGFIHSASLGVYITSPFMIGYIIVAIISYILHLGRGKWFDAPDNFEYV
ncbi:MAG: hypothetical protein K2L08_03310 [Erysipelotrichaceae bacterium]|nr:hypothetical protein [Erysipelotrichaceae bacterium]